MQPSEIKALPISEKTEYLRAMLMNLDNEDEIDILNAYRLVNSYNTFDESFFEQEASYISDIAEFIDIKTELEKEIDDLMVTITTWYLSILASSEIPLTMEQDDSKKTVPSMLYGLFILSSVPMLASIMNKIDLSKIDMTKLHSVKEGFSLMSRLFGNQALVGAFLEKL